MTLTVAAARRRGKEKIPARPGSVLGVIAIGRPRPDGSGFVSFRLLRFIRFTGNESTPPEMKRNETDQRGRAHRARLRRRVRRLSRPAATESHDLTQ